MTTSLSYQLSFNEFRSFQRKVSVAQSYPTLCNPMDCSPPGSSVHGILQTRMLEWVAISSPRDLPNLGIQPGCPELKADSLPPEPLRKPTISKERFKCIALISFYFQPTFATIWTVAHQAPLSMGFSRQECWSGWPLPPPGELPIPGIEPKFSALVGRFFTTEPPGKPLGRRRGSVKLALLFTL